MFGATSEAFENILSAYRKRIDTLQAKQDISDDSVRDFWRLVRLRRHTIPAEIEISENSKLSATWSFSLHSRLSLEFLGGGKTKYDCSVYLFDENRAERADGIGDLQTALSQIESVEDAKRRYRAAMEWLVDMGGSQPDIADVRRQRFDADA